MSRWTATIHYRTDAGPLDVEHPLREIEDLHDLVERGPHWDTIIKIEIVLSKAIEDEDLTIEGGGMAMSFAQWRRPEF